MTRLPEVLAATAISAAIAGAVVFAQPRSTSTQGEAPVPAPAELPPLRHPDDAADEGS